MKSLTTLLFAVGMAAALPASAEVDVKVVIAEAVANTFDGKNYSWTSTLAKPNGGAAQVTGQTQGTTSLVSVQDDNGTHQFAVIGDRHYLNDGTGWKLGPGRPGEDMRMQVPPPSASATPRVRLFFGRPDNPERPLRDAANQVSTWTVQGNTFTGEFAGPPHGPGPGGKGGRRPLMPDAKTTVSLQLQDGLVTSATILTTGTFTPPGESAIAIERAANTTITQVGTTQITLPAELQTLIASGS
jgi:hypothetical protein